MTRKEMFAQINKLGLQDKVMEKYGKNYTIVSNKGLMKVIEDALDNHSSCSCNSNSSSKLDKLITILHKKHILLDSEVKIIMDV